MTNTPMTKAELVTALTARGYAEADLKKLTVPKLRDLLAMQAESAGSDAGATDEEPSDPSLGISESAEGEANVFNAKAGTYVRTYSAIRHGAAYRDLANQFCRKNPHCFIR